MNYKLFCIFVQISMSILQFAIKISLNFSTLKLLNF